MFANIIEWILSFVVFFFAHPVLSRSFDSISVEWETHGKWRMTVFIAFHLTMLVSHPFASSSIVLHIIFSLIELHLCAAVGCFFLFHFISANQLPSERNFMYHSLTFHLFLFQPHSNSHRHCRSDVLKCGRTHTRFSSFFSISFHLCARLFRDHSHSGRAINR